MTYRSDIDGLRAIAILFVLFFHAGLTLFPSGFIGVDIFFVISGFLITGIIQKSLQDNNFSFSEFYSRRLWRLQPVFICLLMTTLLITLLIYLPSDFVHYFKSARKTSLFISNNYFERITTGYFAPSNNQLPLLHTWSLSIEWQCYLILPLAFYLLHRIFGNQYITRIIVLLTLISFALTLYLSSHHPITNYYQLGSRIFEFLMGSCVALGHNRFTCNKYLLELLSLFAMITLFYIATRSNIDAGFPNGYAFILCIATAVLIAVGKHNPKPIVIQFLSLQPMVFIGLISYSLYIWHWPIFASIRYLGIEETTPVLLLAFVSVFILAYLSWRYIEKPARKFNKIKFGYSLLYLFILPAMVFHVGNSVIKKHKGYPQRFSEFAAVDAQLKHYDSSQRRSCLQSKNVPVNPDCVLGSKNSTGKTGFMIGDSYSNQHWRFIDNLAKDANVSVLAHATIACLSLPGVVQYDWKRKFYKACQAQTERYYNMIKTNHYDVVILGQNWNGYLNKLILNSPSEQAQERIEKAIDEALQIITAAGSQPILIKSIALSENPYGCFYDHIKQRRKYNPEHCNFVVNREENKWADQLFSRMKSKYPQLKIIDPKKVQCPEDRCSVDINGVPVFRDEGHITDYAAYQLATLYLQQYKNPLKVARLRATG